MGALPRMGAPPSASREMLGNKYSGVISQPIADPMATSCSTAGRDWARCQTLVVVCDRNEVVGPISHGLAPLEIKEKPTKIREPKDALYERAAELVSALCGLESHRKQGQVPCKHYAGIQIRCIAIVLSTGTRWCVSDSAILPVPA